MPVACWERGLNGYYYLRKAIKASDAVVIPNPWPEPTQKPTVEEAGDALAAAAETIMVNGTRFRDSLAAYKVARGK